MADLPVTITATDAVPNIGISHPVYAIWAPIWRKLAHVYEGSGGFLDGGYIIPHPREWEDHSTAILGGQDGKEVIGWQINPNPSKPTSKLKERRKLARYENVADTIVGQKIAAVFRQEATRTVQGTDTHPWLEWCENVDGQELCLTDFMHDSAIIGMVFGHAVLVMDRPISESPAVTMADVQEPYLRCYTPLDMPDWLVNETNRVTAVKLIEAQLRTDLKLPAILPSQRVRIITESTFEVYDESQGPDGAPKFQPVMNASGQHGFGRLPVVLLYARKRALIPVIGKSVLNDPQLFIDFYNLTSELRELFRKQVFSLLNVPLGTGDQAMGVEDAKKLLGQMVGTMNVVFSGLPMGYISPDTGNVTSYQTEIARLLRMIFRLASVPWESDSKDAESEGSMKLKREDMNQILSGYADKLERAEYEIAELWFRAKYGPDAWQAEWDKAQPTIRYTRTFDVTPFQEMLEQAQAALALPLGQSKTFLYQLALRLLPLFLPNLPDDVLNMISGELEKLPDPQEAKAQRLMQLATAFQKTPVAGAKAAADDLSGVPPAGTGQTGTGQAAA